jgi:hypothetical protein
MKARTELGGACSVPLGSAERLTGIKAEISVVGKLSHAAGFA